MGLCSDLKILYHMVLKPIRGKDHAARLESFYQGQAKQYDQFRKRLLKGRQELWNELGVPEGGIWVDLGGGTGSNLEYFGPGIDRLKRVYLVDLSPSLLAVASQRIADRGWRNVQAVQADATRFRPELVPVDVVTFSYCLTMIPDWFAAIENAWAMLKPGGRVGVVDFYVSRKYPAEGLKRHRWGTRSFWPIWFASDNVFPSPDHLPYLRWRFQQVVLHECRTRLPWWPFGRMPYYIFVGCKPENHSSQGPADGSPR